MVITLPYTTVANKENSKLNRSNTCKYMQIETVYNKSVRGVEKRVMYA